MKQQTYMIPLFALVKANNSDEADQTVIEYLNRKIRPFEESWGGDPSILFDEAIPTMEAKDSTEAEYHSVLDLAADKAWFSDMVRKHKENIE